MVRTSCHGSAVSSRSHQRSNFQAAQLVVLERRSAAVAVDHLRLVAFGVVAVQPHVRSAHQDLAGRTTGIIVQGIWIRAADRAVRSVPENAESESPARSGSPSRTSLPVERVPLLDHAVQCVVDPGRDVADRILQQHAVAVGVVAELDHSAFGVDLADQVAPVVVDVPGAEIF
jgi:hypothetical protein